MQTCSSVFTLLKIQKTANMGHILSFEVRRITFIFGRYLAGPRLFLKRLLKLIEVCSLLLLFENPDALIYPTSLFLCKLTPSPLRKKKKEFCFYIWIT
ncbi:hypothetical protein HHK36_005958 [Tetracentron sinense]|uniref:Uncharacterized protein n=1 Tax=Tetracentron sinense TaxID=13715 RepID=A0A834ZR01_TETSI|nr:hypothetical protein HHK36_005958 [Tetracentron sinense]